MVLHGGCCFWSSLSLDVFFYFQKDDLRRFGRHEYPLLLVCDHHLRIFPYLTYLKFHQDRKGGSLLRSAINGCKLCGLIFKAWSGNRMDLNQTGIYYLYFWKALFSSGAFFVCFEERKRLLEKEDIHNSLRLSFRLFRRNGHHTHCQNVNRKCIFVRGNTLMKWPCLRTEPKSINTQVRAEPFVGHNVGFRHTSTTIPATLVSEAQSQSVFST